MAWKISNIDGHKVSDWNFNFDPPPSRTSFFGATELNGRPAFLKMANPAHRKNIDAINNETAILGSLDHSNIIKPLSSGVFTFNTLLDRIIKTPYIILPAYEQDLEDFTRSGLFTSWELFTMLALQIFESIKYIHANGVIHGDICCRNILLDSTDDLWGVRFILCDFGLSSKSCAFLNNHHREKSYHTPPDERLSCGFDLFSFGVLISRLCARGDIWAWLISSRTSSLDFYPWIPLQVRKDLTNAINSFTHSNARFRESYSSDFMNALRNWRSDFN